MAAEIFGDPRLRVRMCCGPRDSAVGRADWVPGPGQFGASQACGLVLEHTSGMPANSNRERVVAAIRISSRSLDDDQVAAHAGISPRQTVNQICRALERDGMVRRRPEPMARSSTNGSGTRTGNPEAAQDR